MITSFKNESKQVFVSETKDVRKSKVCWLLVITAKLMWVHLLGYSWMSFNLCGLSGTLGIGWYSVLQELELSLGVLLDLRGMFLIPNFA